MHVHPPHIPTTVTYIHLRENTVAFAQCIGANLISCHMGVTDERHLSYSQNNKTLSICFLHAYWAT